MTYSRHLFVPHSFLLASHYTNYDLPQLAINFVVCTILVIAKLPEMMGVRLIGKKPTPKKE